MRRLLVVFSAVVVVVVGGVVAMAVAKGDDVTVKARHTALGTVLADGKGRTLYLFMKDARKDASACSGPCAVNWPPAGTGGKVKVGDGLDGRRLTTFTRADGRTQIAYAGHPLYRFKGDAGKAGAVKGQGIDAFGGKWYVVGTGGKAITRTAPAAAPSNPGYGY
jgi:predicted lipoprotein with Yx(FWY)xxD motif